MLNIAGPLVLGLLGKTVRRNGLDSAGLADMGSPCRKNTESTGYNRRGLLNILGTTQVLVGNDRFSTSSAPSWANGALRREMRLSFNASGYFCCRSGTRTWTDNEQEIGVSAQWTCAPWLSG